MLVNFSLSWNHQHYQPLVSIFVACVIANRKLAEVRTWYSVQVVRIIYKRYYQSKCSGARLNALKRTIDVAKLPN